MGAGVSSRKAAVAMLKDKQATVAKLTFEEIDTDKNGKLSCEEILEALAKHFKEGISKAGIASVVAAFDTDGDGQLDLAVGNWDGEVWFYKGQANAGFQRVEGAEADPFHGIHVGPIRL